MMQRVQTQIVLDVPTGYAAGERLDRYVTGFVLNATRAKVQRAIREGQVTVNGRKETKPSYTVSAGDEIVCTVMRPQPIRVDPEPIALDIVHEDDDVIVVNKPPGMVVHPAYGHRSGTLVNALLHHVGAPAIEADSDGDPDDHGEKSDADEEAIDGLSSMGSLRSGPEGFVRPGIVHRLDKDTSGLLVVAKHDVAHQRIAKQFLEQTIHRRYVALVWGHPPDKGTIDAPIGRSTKDRRIMAVTRRGKASRTHYVAIRRFAHCAELELRLETGRTHQIRVHLAHIGHRVLGDEAYGGREIRCGPDTRNRRAFFRNLFEDMPRQALHALQLEFVHPGSGELVHFESARPVDYSRAIERLEKDR